jgi:hypothetical protein
MKGTVEIKRMIKKQANSEELFVQTISEGMTDLSDVRRGCVTMT